MNEPPIEKLASADAHADLYELIVAEAVEQQPVTVPEVDEDEREAA